MKAKTILHWVFLIVSIWFIGMSFIGFASVIANLSGTNLALIPLQISQTPTNTASSQVPSSPLLVLVYILLWPYLIIQSLVAPIMNSGVASSLASDGFSVFQINALYGAICAVATLIIGIAFYFIQRRL